MALKKNIGNYESVEIFWGGENFGLIWVEMVVLEAFPERGSLKNKQELTWQSQLRSKGDGDEDSVKGTVCTSLRLEEALALSAKTGRPVRLNPRSN